MIQTAKVEVRWQITRDLPRIVKIEQASFAEPWDEATFRQCLRQQQIIAMVAEIHEDVVGYMIYELGKSSLTLVNVAVDPGWRRHGIGRTMIDKLKHKCNTSKRRFVRAALCERNLDAQLWLKALVRQVAPMGAEGDSHEIHCKS